MDSGTIPVLVIFFNRPQVLKEIFEWVRQVKPGKLFLAQDGPRKNYKEDVDKVLECRKIVENIDWECEVHKNYAERNLSCDEREFSAISWCFEHVDKLIILEDDCKPTFDFYRFCSELLERYSDDERIRMISGFNRCNVYKNYPYDYLFSGTCAGWGWATWRRVWDNVLKLKDMDGWDDIDINYYNKIINMDYLGQYHGTIKKAKEKHCMDIAENKVHSWEFWVGLDMIVNNGLAITPTKNMIRYLGLSKDAAHSPEAPEITISRIRKLLNQTAYGLEGIMKHPPFVVRDRFFEKQEYDIFWERNRNRIRDRMESLVLKLKYKRFDLIKKSVKNHLKV